MNPAILPKSRPKRVAIGLALVALIIVGTEVLGYVVATNSDAYAKARDFVQTDSALSGQIGQVTGTRLAPLGAEIRFTAYTGTAKLVIDAETSGGPHKVLVQLEKGADGWSVVKSSILE
jgi:hypothetical protein